MEKNRLDKLENTFFIKQEYCDIKWLKNVGKNFSRITQLSQANFDGKKSSGKSLKTRFL